MTGTSQMQKTCVGINALSAHEVVISAGWLLSALLQESNPNWGKIKNIILPGIRQYIFKGCIKNTTTHE
jgi:hypothetical protein